jgi:hypothetical protein
MKKITISPLATWTPELDVLIEKETAKIPFLEMKKPVDLPPLVQPIEPTEKYGIDAIVKSILLVKIIIDLAFAFIGITAIKKIIKAWRDNGKITIAMLTTVAGMLFSIRSLIQDFSAIKDAIYTLWDLKGQLWKEILDLSGTEWEMIKIELVEIYKA